MPPTRYRGRIWSCAIAMVIALLVLGFAAAPVYADQQPRVIAAADSVPADSGAVAVDSLDESTEKTPSTRIQVVLEKGGEIVIELLSEEAPLAVERIIALTRDRFYDGLKFHRVESYLVQTGKKDSDLPPVAGEMFGQTIRHEAGMVGMARLPDDYDSASTQFYIMKERRPRLNGEYTLIGRVVSGMEWVRKIKKGWKIEKMVVLP